MVHYTRENLDGKYGEELATVTTIDLTGQEIESFDGDLFAGLTQLTKINLSNNQLKELPEGAFSGLTNLNELNLSWNKLEKLNDDVFAGLENLEIIYLQSNEFSKEIDYRPAFETLKDFKKLKWIDFYPAFGNFDRVVIESTEIEEGRFEYSRRLLGDDEFEEKYNAFLEQLTPA